ncbi:MAG: hypothetical protein C0413_02145 [Clostridiales bacterium]|nr:hypothetical protein [Clostridiales bacterium]
MHKKEYRSFEGRTTVNSRERVFTALAHQTPDRPPISATFTPEAERKLRAHLGDADPVGVALGNDLVKSVVGMECSYHASNDPTYVCKWGLTWQNVNNDTGEYTEIIGHPLQDDDGERLDRYRIPDPQEESQYDNVRNAVAKYGKSHFIIGSCQCSLFETAWYLRGMETFLCDMIAEEDYTNALLDKIMQFPLQAGLRMIDIGVDMIWLGDDVATQQTMMISPKAWRKYLKPRYAQMFEAFRKRKKNIVLAYHSCGNCEAILDEMIEIGLDVLNPIQPLAMEPTMIKQRYGDRLTLFGGLDVQHIMPFGTADDVVAEVRRLKRGCGDNGGYILSPAHHIQSDTSIENILTFYQTGKEA